MNTIVTMKRFILICLVVLFASNAYSKVIKFKQIAELVNSQVIIGLSDNAYIDSLLVKSVNANWKLCKLGESMPLKSAYKKAKNNDKLVVISIKPEIEETESYEINPDYIYGGYRISIESKKNDELISQAIPYFDGSLSEEVIKFGLDCIQTNCNLILGKKITRLNTDNLSEYYEENKKLLSTNKLIIPDIWMDDRFSESKLRKYYPHKLEIVDYNTWKSAIITERENTTCLIIVPVANEIDFSCQYYMYDTKLKSIISVGIPSADVLVVSPQKQGSEAGFIDKRIAKMLNKMHN